MDNKEYRVVFRYNAKAGRLHGVVTWGPFSSKEAFDGFCASDEGKKLLSTQEIVEQGISFNRVVELIEGTPAACHIAAAFHAATDPKTGVINERLLMMEVIRAVYAIRLSLHRDTKLVR